MTSRWWAGEGSGLAKIGRRHLPGFVVAYGLTGLVYSHFYTTIIAETELEREGGALHGGLTALLASGSHQLTPPASLPGTPALQAWARPLASSTKVPGPLPMP